MRLHSIFRVGRPHRTWVLLELRPSFCARNGWEVTLRGHMKNSWQMWDVTLYTLDGLNVAICISFTGAWKGGNQLWSGWTVELGEQGLCKNIPVKTVKPIHLVAQSRIPDPIWSNHYGLIGVEWYIAIKIIPPKQRLAHHQQLAHKSLVILVSSSCCTHPPFVQVTWILIIKYPLNPLGTFRKKLS